MASPFMSDVTVTSGRLQLAVNIFLLGRASGEDPTSVPPPTAEVAIRSVWVSSAS